MGDQDEASAARQPAGWRALAGWAVRHRYEIAGVLAVTAAAAFFRMWQLEGIPEGVHGDEATNAIYAERILDWEFHEPYDRFHAHGRPAGFLYLLAGVTALFGNSLLVIRLAAASISLLTIPLAYLLFRAIDGKVTALIGSAFLAMSGWHVIFSRMAWEPGLLVLSEVAAALFLVLALRTEQRWHFALAGLTLGLGIYSHTSYPFFLAPVAIVVAGWLVSKRKELLSAIAGPATMFGTFLLAALPMLSYIWRHQEVFTRPSRSESIFHTDAFQDGGFGQRVDLVLDAGRDFVRLAVFESPPDLIMLALPVSALLGLGLLYAAWRWREPGVALAALVVLVLPWVGILYAGGTGPSMRRTIGVTPFIALLAALPLGAALRTHYFKPLLPRAIASLAVLGVVVSVGVLNWRAYFDDYASRVSIGVPMVEASRYIGGLPQGTYVYFFSSVWHYDHELRLYLAPDTPGEDRSGYWGSELDITPDRSRDVAYVFIGGLLDTSGDVEARYPGGRMEDHLDDDGEVLFRAYELPRDPGAAPADDAEDGAPDDEDHEPTSEDEQRDRVRERDLRAIADALERFREEMGAYPSTGGRVQTLCVFRDADAGCSLERVLHPLPEDPLGASSSNGYWLVSAPDSYVVFALRETALLAACSQPPPAPSVNAICVAGP